MLWLYSNPHYSPVIQPETSADLYHLLNAGHTALNLSIQSTLVHFHLQPSIRCWSFPLCDSTPFGTSDTLSHTEPWPQEPARNKLLAHTYFASARNWCTSSKQAKTWEGKGCKRHWPWLQQEETDHRGEWGADSWRESLYMQLVCIHWCTSLSESMS